jgi:hypothetical protein
MARWTGKTLLNTGNIIMIVIIDEEFLETKDHILLVKHLVG